MTNIKISARCPPQSLYTVCFLKAHDSVYLSAAKKAPSLRPGSDLSVHLLVQKAVFWVRSASPTTEADLYLNKLDEVHLFCRDNCWFGEQVPATGAHPHAGGAHPSMQGWPGMDTQGALRGQDVPHPAGHPTCAGCPLTFGYHSPCQKPKIGAILRKGQT